MAGKVADLMEEIESLQIDNKVLRDKMEGEK
jgi:hypothetical protein